ncbi:MAG: primosomal protein N' [Burkholderiaceae bacterium]|nr:MAG: primosomal protein N' [Burkholderiaceae bacterium]
MIVEVAIDLPNIETLDYSYTPAHTNNSKKTAIIGHWVIVKVKNKKNVGLIVGVKNSSPAKQVKPLEFIIDTLPPVDENFLEFLAFAAKYYHRPLGKVTFNSFPKLLKSVKNVESNYIEKKKNYFSESNRRSCEESKKTFQTKVDWKLNKEQSECYKSIVFSTKPILLHGVTGSGKTRLYFSAIKKILKESAISQVLYLVPEIGLTSHLQILFENYFPSYEIEVYNSTHTPLSRAKTWLNVSTGKTRIILGTRMAVFLPLPNLQLIIADEEHDTSYKQSEGFRYSARDLAVYRANNLKIKIILGSATPSLESWAQVRRNKYTYLNLKNRASGQLLPKLIISQKSSHSYENGISEDTLKILNQHINAGQQALLYLNKKGWAPVLSCLECNWSAKCKNCSVNLVLHKNKDDFLLCHFCGYKELPARFCKFCGSNRLRLLGIGTEQLEHKITRIIPEARIMRIDKQLVKKKKEFDDCLRKIENGDVDIIIGTQILTKGHDFTKVTLVIALEIESYLKHPDFRASERLFQSLVQVSGRAGRHPKQSNNYQKPVFITEVLDPDNDFLKDLSSANYIEFAEKLITERKTWNLPPFTNLATVNLTHSNEGILRRETNRILEELTNLIPDSEKSNVKFSGPLKVFPEKVSKKYRSRILLEANARADLHRIINTIKATIMNTKVNTIIDVDPIDF